MPPLRPTRTGSVTLGDLAAALDHSATSTANAVVTGVSLDSRAVLPGDLYAALPGATTHGARFAGQARDSGAVAVLTDPVGAQTIVSAGLDLPLLVHPSPRSILGAVASLIYATGTLPMRLIGITGTNGKTTTAYLVHSALEALGARIGLIGTVETRIGDERVRSVRTTPEASDLHALLAVMAERGLDACVMEVSSHALRQHRVDGVRYDLAMFTNLSQDHLDFHSGMADYFAAKAALFTPERARQALVCIDDDWGARLAGQCTIPVATLTTHPGGGADWTVTVDRADPSRFILRGQGTGLSLRSALPGDFNVTNTAMAAAGLILLGEDPRAVERAVLTDPHVPGRMEVVTRTADPTEAATLRAVVDYAHTPDAIRAALGALRPSTPGALVVVTGAGGDRDRDKRDDMGRAAAEVADVVVVTDDNPRSEDPATIRAAVLEGARAVADARTGEVSVIEEGDRRAAIRRAVDLARAAGPGATVAVVGKGHETGQEIGGQIHPFDDRHELFEALDPAREDRS
ncbi:MAG: UDP-N-acetylmuramoyl-L-alanyl-D-glutamate--2,6-diaminopimelate ligase [Dermatophilaceae bacterium]